MQSYNFILINAVCTRLKVGGRGVNELLKFVDSYAWTNLKILFYFNILFSLKEKNRPFNLLTLLGKIGIDLSLLFED